MKTLLSFGLAIAALCLPACRSAESASPESVRSSPNLAGKSSDAIHSFGLIDGRDNVQRSQFELQCGSIRMNMHPTSKPQPETTQSPTQTDNQANITPPLPTAMRFFVNIDMRILMPCFILKERRLRIGVATQEDFAKAVAIQERHSVALLMSSESPTPLMLPRGRYHLILDTAAQVLEIYDLHSQQSMQRQLAVAAKPAAAQVQPKAIKPVEPDAQSAKSSVDSGPVGNFLNKVQARKHNEIMVVDQLRKKRGMGAGGKLGKCLYCGHAPKVNKKHVWTDEDIAVLNAKYRRISALVARHEAAANYYGNYKLGLLVPNMFVGVVGAVFALIFVRDVAAHKWITPPVQSIVLAINMALMTTMHLLNHNFNFAARVEQHSNLSLAYKALAVDLRNRIEYPDTSKSALSFIQEWEAKLADTMKLHNSETLIPAELDEEKADEHEAREKMRRKIRREVQRENRQREREYLEAHRGPAWDNDDAAVLEQGFGPPFAADEIDESSLSSDEQEADEPGGDRLPF